MLRLTKLRGFSGSFGYDRFSCDCAAYFASLAGSASASGASGRRAAANEPVIGGSLDPARGIRGPVPASLRRVVRRL